MGVFGTGTATIYLTCKGDAKKVSKMIDKIEERTKKRLDIEVAHFEFYNKKVIDQVVEVSNSSGRVQNCEWQIDQLILELKEMVKNKEILGVAEFTADVMIESNSWYMQDEEFEEGE
jgi:predicted peroxiredoxin